MKTTPSRAARRRSGFTLLELSLAIGVGLAVGAMALAMLNQQTAFLRIFRAQDFLTTEAPVINNYISRVVAQAEGFRLHKTFGDAQAGTQPVLTDGKVLVLRFKQAEGGFRESILAFHDPGTGSGIYYHFVQEDGTVDSPQWSITKEVTDATFAVENGILRIRLSGPNGEEITYSGVQQL